MSAYDWDGTRFAAIAVQRGEGCDHTIGCGVALWILKGATAVDALADLRRRLDDVGGLEAGGEFEVERAYIVTLAQLAPVAAWIAEETARRARRDAAACEASERAQYERLRAKFGG